MGKWLILTGLILLAVGLLALLLERFGLWRLPGDLEFGSENWRVYIPVASCILLSLILSAVVWIISFFRHR